MVSSDIKELSSLSTNSRTIVFKLSPENMYTALMALQLFFLAHTVLSYNIPVQEILSFLEVSSVILLEEKKKKVRQDCQSIRGRKLCYCTNKQTALSLTAA